MPVESDADAALADLRSQLVQFVLDEVGRQLASAPAEPLSTALIDAIDRRVEERLRAFKGVAAEDLSDRILDLLVVRLDEFKKELRAGRGGEPEPVPSGAGRRRDGASPSQSPEPAAVSAPTDIRARLTHVLGLFTRIEKTALAVALIVALALATTVGALAFRPAKAPEAGAGASNPAVGTTATPLPVDGEVDDPAAVATAPVAIRRSSEASGETDNSSRDQRRAAPSQGSGRASAAPATTPAEPSTPAPSPAPPQEP